MFHSSFAPIHHEQIWQLTILINAGPFRVSRCSDPRMIRVQLRREEVGIAAEQTVVGKMRDELLHADAERARAQALKTDLARCGSCSRRIAPVLSPKIIGCQGRRMCPCRLCFAVDPTLGKACTELRSTEAVRHVAHLESSQQRR